ncbi:DUF309 domain-containing protein [bacterium]|nr:DUF309 domain-containing protein [bacterium]
MMDLSPDDKRHFLEGISLFNRGKYYEAHEEIEHIWLKNKTDSKLFLQALIIFAGAFCHIQKKRHAPAAKAFQKVVLKLKRYPTPYFGIDLTLIRKNAQEWMTYLKKVREMPSFPQIINAENKD